MPIVNLMWRLLMMARAKKKGGPVDRPLIIVKPPIAGAATE